MFVLISLSRCTGNVPDESYNGHADRSHHLERLVFRISPLGQSPSFRMLSFANEEEDRGDGGEKRSVEKAERKEFVAEWEDKGDEEGEDCRACDGDLGGL